MIDLPELFLPLKYNIFAARCIHYYKEFYQQDVSDFTYT